MASGGYCDQWGRGGGIKFKISGLKEILHHRYSKDVLYSYFDDVQGEIFSAIHCVIIQLYKVFLVRTNLVKNYDESAL